MKPAFRSLINAFSYAGAGLGHLIRSQRNARIHMALTVAAIILALWLQISPVEWAVLSLTIGLVFLAEAFNTAIEATVDLVSPNNQPLAKIAKDTAAGGVLLAAITALAVALFLFLPPLLTLISLQSR